VMRNMNASVHSDLETGCSSAFTEHDIFTDPHADFRFVVFAEPGEVTLSDHFLNPKQDAAMDEEKGTACCIAIHELIAGVVPHWLVAALGLCVEDRWEQGCERANHAVLTKAQATHDGVFLAVSGFHKQVETVDSEAHV